MGDVNKGVWPSEVRRSNDVNKNNIDPPSQKNATKKQTTINVGQNHRVWEQWVGQPEFHVDLPCHLEVLWLLRDPAAER